MSRVTSLSASGRSYGQAPVTATPSQGRSINTTPDKDRITYPDDLIRDSYGNIVKPYVPLLDSTGTGITGTGAIGHHTDVNKSGGSAQQNLPFVVPSYASGILTGSAGVKVPLSDLLPPLSSGNYNYPELQGIAGTKPSTVPQQNVQQNEVSSTYADSGTSFGSSAPAVSTNFISPPVSSVIPPKTHGNLAAPPPLNTPQNIPQKPTTNPYQQPDQIPVFIQIQPAFGGQGDFGPKPSVPTSHTSPNKNVLPPPPPPAPHTPQIPHAPQTPHAQPSAQISHNQPSPQLPHAQPSPHIPHAQPSPQLPHAQPTQQGPHAQPAPHSSSQEPDKYTGGFGGAPGVLGNQPKPGYAVTPAAPQADTQKPLQASSGTYGGSQSGASLPTAPSQNVGSYGSVPTNPTTGNGSFGSVPAHGASHSSAPVGNNGSHGSTSGAFSGHPTVANGNDGKYSGGFGGPPGLLTPYDKVISVGATATNNAG